MYSVCTRAVYVNAAAASAATAVLYAKIEVAGGVYLCVWVAVLEG